MLRILTSWIFISATAIAIVSAESNLFFPEKELSPDWEGDVIQGYDSAEELFDYMDGGAELYLEYEFRALFVREYHFHEGGDLCVEIYKYSKPEDAYGIFSLDTTGVAVEIGQGGKKTPSAVRFWKYRYYVRIYLWDLKPEIQNAPEDFAEIIAPQIPKTGE
ncbi:MAG: DUF6599 family protein, partial [bacterium]